MLQVNPKIFKAYDIRGIYGEDFDNELAYLLGLAFVELRKNDSDYIKGSVLTVAVAYDMRLSSPLLKDNLIRGLISAGANVIDIGLAATPSLYFAVGKLNCDGGIMVSASHNPKEWNGFKLVRKKGVPISGETGMEFLKEKILENRFIPSEIKGTIIQNNDIAEQELENAKGVVNLQNIKPLKIVSDSANGMGAIYLKNIFKNIPGEFITLNLELDGSFPAHEADPIKEENLEQLKKEVIKNRADLGISTDGDGDRIFFVDDKGETISPALIRGLLAKLFLEDKPGSRIGYDVRPGKITTDLIVENNGVPIMTRVGHSLIKEQMLKDDIYFAGESSGHFFINYEIGCFEYPIIIILKLLQEFSNCGQKISDYIALYNKYVFSGEINRDVKDKEAVLKRIEEKYSDGKIFKLDGISVEYNDFWFNVRGSNTEDKMRLNLEAINATIMEKCRDEVLNLMF